MAIKYKVFEMQIAGLTGQGLYVLGREPVQAPHIEQLNNQLMSIYEELGANLFRVAVIGEFKRGKTSFINSLLRERVLPENVEPATATLNRVTYGDTPRAYLELKDGSRKEIEIGELANYVTKLTDEAAQNAAQIREAVVEYPTMLCRNQLDLIDTPGLNDTDAMTDITLGMLNEVDLAIVVFSAAYPVSVTEKELIARLLRHPHIHHMLFVVTRMDGVRARERDRLLTAIRERIDDTIRGCMENADPVLLAKCQRIQKGMEIFPVSSLWAMDGIEENDNELYAKSGFPELDQALPRLVLSSRSIANILNAIAAIKKHMLEYNLWLEHGRIEDIDKLQAVTQSLNALPDLPEDLYQRYADYVKDAIACVPLELPNVYRALSQVTALDESVVRAAITEQIGAWSSSYVQFVTQAWQRASEETEQQIRSECLPALDAALTPVAQYDPALIDQTCIAELRDQLAKIPLLDDFFVPENFRQQALAELPALMLELNPGMLIGDCIQQWLNQTSRKLREQLRKKFRKLSMEHDELYRRLRSQLSGMLPEADRREEDQAQLEGCQGVINACDELERRFLQALQQEQEVVKE